MLGFQGDLPGAMNYIHDNHQIENRPARSCESHMGQPFRWEPRQRTRTTYGTTFQMKSPDPPKAVKHIHDNHPNAEPGGRETIYMTPLR